MTASLRENPKQRERYASASLTGPFRPALLNSPAAIPRQAVRPKDSRSPRPDPRIIVLFGVIGAIVPFIILSLEQDLGPHIGPDRLLTALRVLVWPVSVFAVGAPGVISTLAALSAVIFNVVVYLVIGGLIWLGLHPPRSRAYLATVSIIYLILVSVAAFCEWLFP